MDFRKNKYLFLIALVFGVIYSLVSIVNHYFFRTYALDLGAYTNALYDYIHFHWNDSSVFKEVNENLLSDHFDLYLILFSPLSLVFKTYTLLLVQIFFILLGGAGVYRYFSLKGKPGGFALCAALYFYLFFGVFSAVSFDYHSNVIAACLIPWFFCFIRQKRVLATSLLFVFILVSKENVSLWMAFICLGLIAEYRKDHFWRNYLVCASVLSVFYFLLITAVVMPALSNNNTYPHFNYSVLGNNFLEAFLFLIRHPFESFRTLFINHTHNPFGDYAKAEFHVLVLVSGLPLLLWKPRYLLMLIPIYFQKLFNDTYTMWGIDGQYSIEFAPVMAIGIFSVISDFRNDRISRVISTVVLVTTLICTVRIMDHTMIFTNKSRIRIYQQSHYSRDYDVKKVYEQMARIPGDAVVSAESPFLPHLAYRDRIYQFPMIRDARYIIYSQKEYSYPMEKKVFDSLTKTLETSGNWQILYKDGNVTLLEKAALRGQ